MHGELSVGRGGGQRRLRGWVVGQLPQLMAGDLHQAQCLDLVAGQSFLQRNPDAINRFVLVMAAYLAGRGGGDSAAAFGIAPFASPRILRRAAARLAFRAFLLRR